MDNSGTVRAGWVLAVAVALAGCSSEPSGPASSSSTIVFTGARLIDGTGRPPIESAALVVTDGRVAAVGASDALEVPSGARRIDVTGKTITPGLINAHAHLNNGDPALSPQEQITSQLGLYARFGVTTVYSLGDDGKVSIEVRDRQAGGAPDGARLFVSGEGVTPKTVEEARSVIDGHAEAGVNIIKTRLEGNPNDMTPEVYTALIGRAHERNLRVAAHIFYMADAGGLVDAGVDVIAHSVRDRDVDPAFIDKLVKAGVGYIPTLTRDLSVFVYESRPDFLDDPFFQRGIDAYGVQVEQVSNPELQERMRTDKNAQAIKPALAQANRNLKLLSDGGVMIALGTDSGTSLGRWQGYFEHHELAMMVDAGLTPMQALVAATGNAARVMRLDELGTLEPGKWADLLVLDANPLDDIRNTRRIDSVWIAGREVEGASEE
jgi:imidazolonepropionase-like amidohydrolase